MIGVLFVIVVVIFVVVVGRLAATGSGDSSIKLLDVDKMMSQTAVGHQQEVHPVIRSLYDHGDVSGRGRRGSRCRQ